MQPASSTLQRLGALLLLITGTAGVLAGNVCPVHAAAIRGITLHAFDCTGPALELSLTGDFTTDDGGGMDNVNIRITDGVGTLLFNIIGGSAGSALDWQFAVSDEHGLAPDPRANPVRIEVYEYVGAYPGGRAADLLASATFNVPCLAQSAATPGLPSFAGPRVPVGAARLPATTRFTAYLYSAPRATAQRIETIGPNTAVVLFGRDLYNQWAQVVLPDGRAGWMSMNMLSVTLDQIQVLPVR